MAVGGEREGTEIEDACYCELTSQLWMFRGSDQEQKEVQGEHQP